MRKAVAFLGASLGLAWVVAANAQTAPDTFKDVPSDHWAYQAVDALRAKGILVGYPDGLYRGKRTMTRYEFAVALKRALESIGTIKGDKGEPGAPGAPGAQGPQGEAGPQGPTGVSPEELAAIKKLADEFKAELAKVGVDVNAANAKLDKLAKDLAAVKAELAGMPKFFGDAFIGIRSDRANGNYYDQNGRWFSPRSGYYGLSHYYDQVSLVNEALVTHDFRLGVKAKLGEDATVTGALVFGNYANAYDDYLAGNDTYPLVTKPQGWTYVDQLEIKSPFNGVGREGELSIGRFGFNISPLTLWKPDIDVYTQNPIVDDGMFRLDGFKVGTKLGSLGATVFGGKTDQVQGYHGDPMMQPIAGVTNPGIFFGMKPTAMTMEGSVFVNQVGGLTLSLPTNKVAEGGHVRVVGLLATGDGGSIPSDDEKYAPSQYHYLTNVTVLGADTKLPFGEKLVFDGAFSKTITGAGRFKAVNVHENNAFDGGLSFTTGGVSVKAGYKYIDPMFYAPGYWGRIGNWINPTNIQGPSLKLGYDFSPSFGITLAGDMLTAARNRAAEGSLGKDDRINRAVVGVKWDLSQAFQTTLEYEGVFYKMVGAHAGLTNSEYTGTTHPTEEYLTLGTNYKVNGFTLLKLGYQVGAYKAKIFGGEGSGNYNYNTFFSQVAVKF